MTGIGTPLPSERLLETSDHLGCERIVAFDREVEWGDAIGVARVRRGAGAEEEVDGCRVGEVCGVVQGRVAVAVGAGREGWACAHEKFGAVVDAGNVVTPDRESTFRQGGQDLGAVEMLNGLDSTSEFVWAQLASKIQPQKSN